MITVEKIKQVLKKIYGKEILAVFLLLIAIYFFRSERRELTAIVPHLRQADTRWLITGISVTVIYIMMQSLMYINAFSAVGSRLSLGKAIELFLKRNFLSVFLPAGGVRALAYTPSRLRKSELKRVQIHQESAIYAFTGMVTVFIVGIPILIYTLFGSVHVGNTWPSLLLIAVVIAALYLVVRSFRQKGLLYRFITNRFPSLIPSIDELFSADVSVTRMVYCILSSLGVECTGIFHVFIAMMALGLSGSLMVGAIAYIVSVLLMMLHHSYAGWAR